MRSRSCAKSRLWAAPHQSVLAEMHISDGTEWRGRSPTHGPAGDCQLIAKAGWCGPQRSEDTACFGDDAARGACRLTGSLRDVGRKKTNHVGAGVSALARRSSATSIYQSEARLRRGSPNCQKVLMQRGQRPDLGRATPSRSIFERNSPNSVERKCV